MSIFLFWVSGSRFRRNDKKGLLLLVVFDFEISAFKTGLGL